mmetsp:Transcript_33320/g.60218  ORF Transcript_33320/g.60218 Transcript_33320/m.60218 type:complete len:262 (-) Transcript_33320:993-1778(-)|eukprot:CAMPEP_0175086120 /NCGR_PEP_ID=MMETSP0052_2-20121109/29061_1 /TAXON_ID=51329 ORGANISM="Polytomella parva, Strain SAG 63-3" /NCGR_SAMPLE_ID=MMETSP0052_2 /ASSEMBLY_ACC=CAM_ASM_000194 /LENGTH=261 /DNA_ID=CAMNT_0016358245 /DNA_START=176 /DNA_END=961 /DNA_ORIENTATION=+
MSSPIVEASTFNEEVSKEVNLKAKDVSAVDSDDERDVQKAYWAEHSKSPTVEAMMLDSKASEIDRLERPEMMSLISDVISGHDMLELGAGIGRFTGELVNGGAKSLIAVDFMQTSIDENKRVHGHLPNVSFLCADVTTLQLPAASIDVIFSNWLLMYLSDKEVGRLAKRSLTWLRPGGTLFFRESCFQQSGDRARGANPTHYRDPVVYSRLFQEAVETAADGLTYRFELKFSKSVDTYVQVKNNQNQICWRWVKVPVIAEN